MVSVDSRISYSIPADNLSLPHIPNLYIEISDCRAPSPICHFMHCQKFPVARYTILRPAKIIPFAMPCQF